MLSCMTVFNMRLRINWYAVDTLQAKLAAVHSVAEHGVAVHDVG